MVAFVWQMVREIHLPKYTPGGISSGAMNDIGAVLGSALIAGMVAGILLEGCFLVLGKIWRMAVRRLHSKRDVP